MSEKHTTLILVRHGKATTTGEILPGRTPGLHLSDEGKTQAQATAKYLARYLKPSEKDKDSEAAPPKIYTSPLERTVETTAPIAQIFSTEPEIEDGLLEADFGDWTGQKLADLRRLDEWKVVQTKPSEFSFPNGESFVDMQSRIVSGLSRLCEENKGQTVIAVSHADMIKSAMAHYLGMHLNDFQRLTVNPCSLSAIQVGETPRVLFMNQSASGPIDPNIG